jgi:hypothetical protein
MTLQELDNLKKDDVIFTTFKPFSKRLFVSFSMKNKNAILIGDDIPFSVTRKFLKNNYRCDGGVENDNK